MFEAVGLLGPPAPVGLSKVTYRISSIKSPPLPHLLLNIETVKCGACAY